MSDTTPASVSPNDIVDVFHGFLDECKERQRMLLKEDIETSLYLNEAATAEHGGALQIFTVGVEHRLLPIVADIFEEVWEESLAMEGVDVEAGAVDLSAESIDCPACSTTITELTAEGECPECGLFLGFPEE